jgi:hypothetical protein
MSPALLLVPLLSTLSTPRSPGGLDIPPALQTLLSAPRWDGTPRGFRIVALSFVADAGGASA